MPVDGSWLISLPPRKIHFIYIYTHIYLFFIFNPSPKSSQDVSDDARGLPTQVYRTAKTVTTVQPDKSISVENRLRRLAADLEVFEARL